jgi:hypothetical protein
MRRRATTLVAFGTGAAMALCACGGSTTAGAISGEDAAYDAYADAPLVAARDATSPEDAAGDPPDAADEGIDATVPLDGPACAKAGVSETCGVSPQCGCAPNQTCDFAWNVEGDLDTTCVGPPGVNLEGNVCVNTSSCALGLSCAMGGTCHAFCRNPGEACTGERQGQCIQVVDGTQAAVFGLALCEIKCALQDPDACGPFAACYPSGVTGGSDCGRAGTVEPDGECSYLNDCQAGYGCVGPANQKRHCERWCRVGLDDCASRSCAPLNPALVINDVTYGTCP